MSNAQQVLSEFAQSYSPQRASQYGRLIEQTAEQAEADPANAASIVRGAGQRIGVSVPQHVIDQIEAAVRPQFIEGEVPEPVVNFLTDVQVEALVGVANKAGYPGDEASLRAEFVEAGLLEPEPEPEPEPEEDDSSLLQRLVAFAKEHGFK